MRKRNLPGNKTKNSKVNRQRDPIPWKYCLLTLACGLLLIVGFFYAARSHFSSMEYAMKNAELRKQIDDLQSEARRLKLAREIALSPAEIKIAAEKFGLTTMTARNIEVLETKPVEKSFENLDKKENDRDVKSKSEPKSDSDLKKKDKRETSTKSDKTDKDKLENKKPEKKENQETFKKDGNLKTQIAKK
ncbi:MAG: hypothetical protein ACR2MD_15785 [Aridibacter sp.]